MTIWKKSCQISTKKLKTQLTLVSALFQGYFPSKFIKSNNEIYIYIYIGEGNGNPVQYSCLENSMDRGALGGRGVCVGVGGVPQSKGHKESDTPE